MISKWFESLSYEEYIKYGGVLQTFEKRVALPETKKFRAFLQIPTRMRFNKDVHGSILAQAAFDNACIVSAIP